MPFGRVDGVLSSQQQTKEWEARTLRLMALTELGFGTFTTLIALEIIDESAVAGLIFGGIGVGMAYLGYQDMKAAKRFFYPQGLLSSNDSDYGVGSGKDKAFGNKLVVPLVAFGVEF